MPGIEYDTAVGHHHRLLPVMGDVHGGDAGLLLERLDLVAHFLADPCIEIGQGLVKEQDPRVDGEGAAERGPVTRSNWWSGCGRGWRRSGRSSASRRNNAGRTGAVTCVSDRA
jgi:hypothetical protein